jgi:ribonucleoside-diphosphate reductase beta chain
LLHGLASGTNWVFRDESCHMAFAFEVIRTAREEEPDLFDDDFRAQVVAMMREAVECEVAFAEDTLSGGVAGLSLKDMREYLEYCADQRMAQLGIPKHFGARNPFPFMDLQDVQELTNFFERRVSAYQVGVQGEVGFDHAF